MTASPPIVVTGPTGWIGQALLTRIAAARGAGWQHQVRLFGSHASDIIAPDGSVIAVRPLDELTGADVDAALVVHLAYLTKEKADLLGERRFTDTNLAIDDRLLAAFRAGNPRAVFVASSGAAALAAQGIDRHPYGLCKLRQEDRLLAWSRQSRVPVLVGRIWNIAGPFMNKTASYALSDMLIQARRTRSIRIAASFPVFRSYLHVEDLADLILRGLSAGIGFTHPIDFCGAEVLEMSDLAERIAELTGLTPEAIVRGPVDTSRSSIYLGQFAQTKALAMRVGLQLAAFQRQLVDTDCWLEATYPA